MQFLPILDSINIVFRGLVNNVPNTPTLLCSKLGTGRYSYIQALIRQRNCIDSFKPFTLEAQENSSSTFSCSCIYCEKITKNKTKDIIIVDGLEDSISDVRSKCEDVYGRASELDYLYLIIKNVDSLQNLSQDILLKIFEEPTECLKIFVTSRDVGSTRSAILSRCLIYRLNFLSKDHLKILTDNVQELKLYRNLLDQFNFESIEELRIFSRWRIGDQPFEMIISSTSLDNTDTLATTFIENVLKEKNVFDVQTTVSLSIRYLLSYLRNLSTNNMLEERSSTYYHLLCKIENKWQYSFIEVMCSSEYLISYQYLINLKQSYRSFIHSLYNIKVLAGNSVTNTN